MDLLIINQQQVQKHKVITIPPPQHADLGKLN